MLEPTIPGWKVETLGDDIAWMRFGDDGRLYAINPEYGLFGVAPGTDWKTNPNAMRTLDQGNSVFTNVALTDDGDIWWEGMGEPPAHLTDWKGQRLDAGLRRAVEPPQLAASAPRSSSARSSPPSTTTRSGVPISPSCSAAAARPRSRWSPRPATGCTASTWAPPSPRRRPPPPPARSASCAATRWRCCRSSATTPATTSGTGSRWARAPAPATPTKLPKIFYVNWFRRGDDGRFLWPGFGENSRVLKWVVERLEGTAAGGRDPDRVRCRRPERSTSTGLDLDRRRPRSRPAGRRRGVEGRDPAGHRVVRQVRRQAARRPLGRAGRAQGPPRRRVADRADGRGMSVTRRHLLGSYPGSGRLATLLGVGLRDLVYSRLRAAAGGRPGRQAAPAARRRHVRRQPPLGPGDGLRRPQRRAPGRRRRASRISCAGATRPASSTSRSGCCRPTTWRRPATELDPLLQIIEDLVGRPRRRGQPLAAAMVGALDLLPAQPAAALKAAAERTAGRAGGAQVNIAVGYGGRREIADAVRSLLNEHAQGRHVDRGAGGDPRRRPHRRPPLHQGPARP